MPMVLTRKERHIIVGGCISAVIMVLVLAIVSSVRGKHSPDNGMGSSLTEPVRTDIPDRIPLGTHWPKETEGRTSGSIDYSTFSPGRDLCYVDDTRVWWESDHDKAEQQIDDDHTIHRSMEDPLQRVIELVSRRGGTLEVHSAFRPVGCHGPRSLHKEGRAVDLTCDEMPMEDLAKLCWAAGFDWVYHEKGGRAGGPHVHCSVRR